MILMLIFLFLHSLCLSLATSFRCLFLLDSLGGEKTSPALLKLFYSRMYFPQQEHFDPLWHITRQFSSKKFLKSCLLYHINLFQPTIEGQSEKCYLLICYNLMSYIPLAITSHPPQSYHVSVLFLSVSGYINFYGFFPLHLIF